MPKHWKEAEKFISSYNAIRISALSTEGCDLGCGFSHGPLVLKPRFCQGATTCRKVVQQSDTASAGMSWKIILYGQNWENSKEK